MVTRSKTGLILAIIATVFTFGLYFILSTAVGSPAFEEIIDEIGDRDLEALLSSTMKSLVDMTLYFGIANIALGILGWRFKFANGLLALLGWVYLLGGGFILFLIQGILCIVASAKNKKYWIELDLLKKIEKENELRAAVEAKAKAAE